MNILNIQYNIFSVHAPGPMTFLFILDFFFFFLMDRFISQHH